MDQRLSTGLHCQGWSVGFVPTTAVVELKVALGTVTALVSAGHLEGLSESELLATATVVAGSIPGSSDPPWRPPLRPRDGGGWGYDIPGEHEPTTEELEADTDLAAITEVSADLDDHESWWNRFLGEQPRHVLDVGRPRRTAPPKIRRALAIRDGGCDTDPSRCEAHHVTYWEHHGETSISNLVLLCTQHHHMVHEVRWRIDRTTDLDPGHPSYLTLVTPAHRA